MPAWATSVPVTQQPNPQRVSFPVGLSSQPGISTSPVPYLQHSMQVESARWQKHGFTHPDRSDVRSVGLKESSPMGF